MRVVDFNLCYKLMDRIKSEDALLNLSVYAYPHSKKDFQNKLHKELHLRANPRDESSPALSTAALADILASGGSYG